MLPTIQTHEAIEWNADGQRVRVVYRDEVEQVDANTQTTISHPVSVEVLPDDWQMKPGPKEVKENA